MKIKINPGVTLLSAGWWITAPEPRGEARQGLDSDEVVPGEALVPHGGSARVGTGTHNPTVLNLRCACTRYL